MKKHIALILIIILFISLYPVITLAEGGDGDEYYTEFYTVTVPAKLSPGESGVVEVNGFWSDNKIVVVTCPNTVTLSYNNQTLDVGVNFDGLSILGNPNAPITSTANISIDDATVLFGTWTGTLYYDVQIKDAA